MRRLILRIALPIVVAVVPVLVLTMRLGAWMPEGDQLTMNSNGDIFLVDIDRQLSYAVVHTPMVNEVFGAWSPDGRYMVYIAGETPHIYDTQQGTIRRLPDDPVIHYSSVISWSPDPAYFAIAALNGSTQQLEVRRMNLFTGASEVIYSDNSVIGMRWSPDGTAMILTYIADGIAVLPLDTAGALAVTLPIVGENPVWSSTGDSVIFSSRVTGTHQLYQYFVEGGEGRLHRLTDTVGGNVLYRGGVVHGDNLLFISRRHQQHEIYQYDLSTGAENRLTTQPSIKWAPQWSPDGTRIAFLASPTAPQDQPQLYIMHMDGSAQRQISTRFEIGWGVQPAWRP